MIVSRLAFAAIAAFLAVVDAQTCTPASSDLVTLQDVPVGGFPPVVGGDSRPVDNAEGTFGGENVTFEFTGAFAKVVPTAPETGYWFFKFEQRECWDATGYNGIEFDFSAPVGGSFDMTFTVHDSSCLTNNCSADALSCTRAPDSTYIPISRYVTPNGAVQHVSIPLSDFSPNSDGNGTVDWRYIKDWTFIKFAPVGAEFTFNNFIVKAGCMTNATVTTAGGAAPAGPTGATGGSTSQTVAGASGAGSTASPSPRTAGAGSIQISGLLLTLSLVASVFTLLF